MPEDRRCGTCRFFATQHVVGGIPDMHPCHYGPPQLSPHGSVDGIGIRPLGAFPWMDTDDYCWRWEPMA